jgi:hypothetical protein
MKYDKDFSAYIRDVSERLDGVSAGIRGLDLGETIAIAQETGRIPDREPPGHDRSPGMER